MKTFSKNDKKYVWAKGSGLLMTRLYKEISDGEIYSGVELTS